MASMTTTLTSGQALLLCRELGILRRRDRQGRSKKTGGRSSQRRAGLQDISPLSIPDMSEENDENNHCYNDASLRQSAERRRRLEEEQAEQQQLFWGHLLRILRQWDQNTLQSENYLQNIRLLYTDHMERFLLVYGSAQQASTSPTPLQPQPQLRRSEKRLFDDSLIQHLSSQQCHCEQRRVELFPSMFLWNHRYDYHNNYHNNDAEAVRMRSSSTTRTESEFFRPLFSNAFSSSSSSSIALNLVLVVGVFGETKTSSSTTISSSSSSSSLLSTDDTTAHYSILDQLPQLLEYLPQKAHNSCIDRLELYFPVSTRLMEGQRRWGGAESDAAAAMRRSMRMTTRRCDDFFLEHHADHESFSTSLKNCGRPSSCVVHDHDEQDHQEPSSHNDKNNNINFNKELDVLGDYFSTVSPTFLRSLAVTNIYSAKWLRALHAILDGLDANPHVVGNIQAMGLFPGSTATENGHEKTEACGMTRNATNSGMAQDSSSPRSSWISSPSACRSRRVFHLELSTRPRLDFLPEERALWTSVLFRLFRNRWDSQGLLRQPVTKSIPSSTTTAVDNTKNCRENNNGYLRFYDNDEHTMTPSTTTTSSLNLNLWPLILARLGSGGSNDSINKGINKGPTNNYEGPVQGGVMEPEQYRNHRQDQQQQGSLLDAHDEARLSLLYCVLRERIDLSLEANQKSSHQHRLR